MAGGGADDCVLAIGHTDADGGRLVVDLVARQSGERVNGTYNPLLAVAKFADIMREYHITRVVLDGYAGHTFQHQSRTSCVMRFRGFSLRRRPVLASRQRSHPRAQ
jgi:hypothetical protein